MLTGKMVRVRHGRDRIIASYIDPDSANWLETAEQMLELFRGQEGRSHGEIEADVEEAFGDDPGTLVHQGLVKLLEDRCEFEVVSGHPPEELRDTVFRAAALERASGGREPPAAEQGAHAPRSLGFDRETVLTTVAASLGISPEEVDRGLFADLRTEQHLIKFKDITAKHLLERYNVALAQAILLRSIRVHLAIRNEPPQRYRALLRQAKFHRLICEVQKTAPNSYLLHFDGPLSLFSATQKYGLQLAMFLPAVLHCRDFELRAELRWGADRKPKTFLLTPADALVPFGADPGTYVPPELGMFVELFRKRRPDWELVEETDLFPLGDGFWVPDFRLRHKATLKMVRMEVLGFWRRSSAEKHLQRLRGYLKEPFLLAVSDALHIEEAELEDLPAGIVRFRQLPLPDEVARRAAELLGIEDAPPTQKASGEQKAETVADVEKPEKRKRRKKLAEPGPAGDGGAPSDAGGEPE